MDSSFRPVAGCFQAGFNCLGFSNCLTVTKMNQSHCISMVLGDLCLMWCHVLCFIVYLTYLHNIPLSHELVFLSLCSHK